MRKFLLLILVPLFATGCVIGNKYTFDYKPASMPNLGSGATVVLMQPADLRPYVVKGEEPKTFVGEMRNGYGMPFNVTTADQRPFAEVIGDIAARDLTAAGFNVVRGGAGLPDQIPAALTAQNAKRGLYVAINELNANTFTNIDMEWDLDATVYDQSGKVVQTKKVQGKESLAGSMMNPAKASKKKVPEFIYQKVHELIAGVTSALAGN